MTRSASLNSKWVNQRVREALTSGSQTELLKALVDAIPGNWFFTRVDGTFAFVNQNACNTLGYERKELMALTLFDVDVNMTKEMWSGILAQGSFKPGSVRTLHRRKDGTVFPVEAVGSRIVLGEEDVSVSYVVDLSEQAQTTQELVEKQHLLQSLLDGAPVMVWYVDSDGRFQLSEGSALRLIGLAPGEGVGKTVSELFPLLADLERATARALQGHSVEGVVSVESCDLEYRYVPRRDRDGKVIGATGVAIDITARRSAEHANVRLMNALEQTDESILLLDRLGRIEYTNAAFEDVAGTPKAEMQGRYWPDLLPHGRDEEASRLDLARAITQGTSWRGTLRGAANGQDERVIQASISPLRDGEGRLTGFVAGGRDITEQTRTEERLRQIEKMEAVGQLAGGVAHDFNNLLQVILGNTQLCLANDTSSDQLQGWLSEIQQAGKRAASLVKQLLSFSRNVGEPKSVALGDLVDRMLPLLKRLLGEHIRIEVERSGGHFDVWGDESQLEQIIVNLGVNARDAMPEGGRLEIRMSWCEIGVGQAGALGLARPGDYVALDVEDTGCGMREEIRRRIFEPFFTTKAPGAGTGLGLATVFAVAKRHGGSIQVRSQVGQGSRFRVFLPRAEHPKEMPAPLGRPSACATRPLRILLAENERSVLEVTHHFLADAGHHVVAVEDGEAALALVKTRASDFDLLVLDAIMPRVNGPEVYRAFRAVSAAPVLFVTGHEFNVLEALPPDPTRALLRKPFSDSDLASAIAKLFDAGIATV
jgi:two-component system cell cycle sensor histidine kinase/response regulator CckA